MSKTIEKMIIKAIAELQIEEKNNKLKVSDVAKRAGISRQAIYSLYKHLRPYISGKKPLEEVLDNREYTDIQSLAELQTEATLLRQVLHDMEQQHQIDLESEHLRITTNLMQRDIEIHSSATTKSELHKKTIQLNNKINDLKVCQNINTALEAQIINLQNDLQSVASGNFGQVDKVTINHDMNGIELGDYRTTAKQSENDSIEQLKRTITGNTTAVIVFINRFNSSYTDFTVNNSRQPGQYIYISLVLPTARDRKKFIRLLPANTSVVAVIFEPNLSYTNWYRRLHCKEVPSEELDRLDNAWQPVLLNEGFSEIAYYKEAPTDTRGNLND